MASTGERHGACEGIVECAAWLGDGRVFGWIHVHVMWCLVEARAKGNVPAPAIISRCRGRVPSGSSSASLSSDIRHKRQSEPHNTSPQPRDHSYSPQVAEHNPSHITLISGQVRCTREWGRGYVPAACRCVMCTHLSMSLAASLMAFSGVTPVRLAPSPAHPHPITRQHLVIERPLPHSMYTSTPCSSRVGREGLSRVGPAYVPL